MSEKGRGEPFEIGDLDAAPGVGRAQPGDAFVREAARERTSRRFKLLKGLPNRSEAGRDPNDAQAAVPHGSSKCIMPCVSPKVWTPRRKLLGNLIPLLFALPFAVWGATTLVRTGEVFGPGLWQFSLAPVVAWFGMCLLGLAGNESMRGQLIRLLRLPPPSHEESRWFVGFSRPSHFGLLDPHEDIGFLRLTPTAIRFEGERYRVEIPTPAVERVRFRANAHSWVGLGRWISIEGTLEGQKIRMLVEPRERATLLGNLILSGEIRRRLAEAIKGKDPGDRPRSS